MDDCFLYFLKNFGPTVPTEEIPDSFFHEKAGVLPNNLLNFWREVGWGSYCDGLFWTVNPDNYVGLVEQWTAGIPVLENAKYHVFARTAFGKIFALRQDTGHIIHIETLFGNIFADESIGVSSVDREAKMESFFTFAKKKGFDFPASDGGTYLFDAAVKKLGQISSSQMYGFEPMLSAGGVPIIDNLRKLSMDVHLDILCQFLQKKLYMM